MCTVLPTLYCESRQAIFYQSAFLSSLALGEGHTCIRCAAGLAFLIAHRRPRSTGIACPQWRARALEMPHKRNHFCAATSAFVPVPVTSAPSMRRTSLANLAQAVYYGRVDDNAMEVASAKILLKSVPFAKTSSSSDWPPICRISPSSSN